MKFFSSTSTSIYPLGDIYTELKRSLSISFPMIISQLVYALNGFIATAFIAHLGKHELATNALVWGIFITLILFFIGVLSAVSVVVAQRHGANDIDGMRQTLSQGMILAVLSAIPSMLILYFGSDILFLLGQNKIIVNLSNGYFHSLSYCILPVYILVTIQQFLMGMGRTKLVLFIGLMEVPMQLFFFYTFVFGKFHSHKFGLSGIGLGIMIVVAIWAIIMSLYLRFSPKYCQYKIFSNYFIFDKLYILELLKVGLPLGFMYCVEVALFAACAFMMGIFGPDMLAAHQIAYQCFVFAIVIVFGFSQGTTVRTSYEVGKNDKNTLRLSFYVHLITSFSFAFICALLYLIFSKYIIGLDIDTSAAKYSDVVKYAESFLKVVSVLLLVESLRGVLIGVLRGLKHTKTTMYVSMMTYWLVAFPVAYLLAFVFSFKGLGIWWGITSGVLIATIILWVKTTKVIKNIDLKSLHVVL